MDSAATTTCPYCKETILANAIKCKHCGSAVGSEKPAHGGICPYCKEQINPEATRCKHCKSDVGPRTKSGCGCGCSESDPQGPARKSPEQIPRGDDTLSTEEADACLTGYRICTAGCMRYSPGTKARNRCQRACYNGFVLCVQNAWETPSPA
jgi:hypothetical protein